MSLKDQSDRRRDPWWVYVVIGAAIALFFVGLGLGLVYDAGWLWLSVAAFIFFYAG